MKPITPRINAMINITPMGKPVFDEDLRSSDS
jgi:hypothetical protein